MIIVALVVIIFGLRLVLRGVDDYERRLIVGSIALRVLSAFVLVWISRSYYGGGQDMEGSVIFGSAIARLLDQDFFRFFPAVIKAILQFDDNGLPIVINTGTNTSQSMAAIAGLIMFTLGTSTYVTSIAFAVLSWFGQVAMYRAVREQVQPSERRLVAVGLLFVPSVVFWSAGIIKEAVALGSLGWLSFGALRLSQRQWLKGGVAALVGVLGVGVVKPYILFPFILGIGGWIFASRRSRGTAKPRTFLYLIVAVVVASSGLLVVGTIFPQFALDKLGGAAAHYQEIYADINQSTDGSYVDLGDPTQTTLVGQLRFAPLALINALFRPAFFEVKNFTMALAAVETTILTVLTLVVAVRSFRNVVPVLINSPLLLFCFFFVLTFGVAVGLSTSNLGTLSRYRMPMMPFYVTGLLIFYRRARRTKRGLVWTASIPRRQAT